MLELWATIQVWKEIGGLIVLGIIAICFGMWCIFVSMVNFVNRKLRR